MLGFDFPAVELDDFVHHADGPEPTGP